MLLKTKDMYERLVKSGFTDEQAGGLVAVLAELAETFVTKDYLDVRLDELREEMRAEMYRMAFIIVASTAALLTLFEFVV